MNNKNCNNDGIEDFMSNTIEEIVIRDLIILEKEKNNLTENGGLIFDTKIRDVYVSEECQDLENFLNTIYKIFNLKIEKKQISSETTFSDLINLLFEEMFKF